MKRLYVYILQCKDGTFYTGVTNYPDRRLQEHQDGIDPKSYTYHRRPVKLVFKEGFKDPMETITAEKQLKKWSHKKKKALVEGKLDLLPKLAKKDFRK